MASEATGATLHIEPGLHQAQRLKAASAHRTMSDIVYDAIRAALRDASSNSKCNSD